MIVAILLANAIFSIVTWPTFLRRVAKDPRARDESGKATAFSRVHVVLVSVAMVLAALSLLAAVLILIGVW